MEAYLIICSPNSLTEEPRRTMEGATMIEGTEPGGARLVYHEVTNPLCTSFLHVYQLVHSSHRQGRLAYLSFESSQVQMTRHGPIGTPIRVLSLFFFKKKPSLIPHSPTSTPLSTPPSRVSSTTTERPPIVLGPLILPCPGVTLSRESTRLFDN